MQDYGATRVVRHTTHLQQLRQQLHLRGAVTCWWRWIWQVSSRRLLDARLVPLQARRVAFLCEQDAEQLCPLYAICFVARLVVLRRDRGARHRMLRHRQATPQDVRYFVSQRYETLAVLATRMLVCFSARVGGVSWWDTGRCCKGSRSGCLRNHEQNSHCQFVYLPNDRLADSELCVGLLERRCDPMRACSQIHVGN